MEGVALPCLVQVLMLAAQPVLRLQQAVRVASTSLAALQHIGLGVTMLGLGPVGVVVGLKKGTNLQGKTKRSTLAETGARWVAQVGLAWKG